MEEWIKPVKSYSTIGGRNWARHENNRSRSWSALDPDSKHPVFNPTLDNSADQGNNTLQFSEELISVNDSADVEINTTNTQAAVSLQAALQLAITAIISIAIADSEKADKVKNELLQKASTKQINRQHTYVHNSRNVTITTTDTEIAVNIQILLQILIALLVKLDIL